MRDSYRCHLFHITFLILIFLRSPLGFQPGVSDSYSVAAGPSRVSAQPSSVRPAYSAYFAGSSWVGVSSQPVYGKVLSWEEVKAFGSMGVWENQSFTLPPTPHSGQKPLKNRLFRFKNAQIWV